MTRSQRARSMDEGAEVASSIPELRIKARSIHPHAHPDEMTEKSTTKSSEPVYPSAHPTHAPPPPLRVQEYHHHAPQLLEATDKDSMLGFLLQEKFPRIRPSVAGLGRRVTQSVSIHCIHSWYVSGITQAPEIHVFEIDTR